MGINAKLGGGKMLLNPLGVLNDGLMEVVTIDNPRGGRGHLMENLDAATKKGGI